MRYIFKSEREIAKIFSDKTRLKIIELLSEKELTNTQIAKLTNLSKATVTHHIKILLDAGIVKISKITHEEHGIQMKFYTLNPNILQVTPHRDDKLREHIKKEILKIINSEKTNTEARVTFLRLLKSSILNTGIEMDKAFYDTGYEVGASIISKQIKGETPEEVLKEIADLWEALKLGRIEIIDATRIKVKDCYQCAHMPDIERTLCPGEAGIIAGILDETLGKGHFVKETKCWGTGYDFCEFEIKKAKNDAHTS